MPVPDKRSSIAQVGVAQLGLHEMANVPVEQTCPYDALFSRCRRSLRLLRAVLPACFNRRGLFHR